MTDVLQTVAIVVLGLNLMVVTWFLRKTMVRASKLKATIIIHDDVIRANRRHIDDLSARMLEES